MVLPVARTVHRVVGVARVSERRDAGARPDVKHELDDAVGRTRLGHLHAGEGGEGRRRETKQGVPEASQ